jgi:hypothetical protein
LRGYATSGKVTGSIPISGWIILKLIVERYVVVVWTGLNWLKIGTSGGLL